jgi:hypothetical protein
VVCWVAAPGPDGSAADPQEQPSLVGDIGGANVGAEGDRGAAVVLGEDRLAQGCESVRVGHSRPEDGGMVVGGAGVVLPVGVAEITQVAAVQFPSVQAVGEAEVSRLMTGLHPVDAFRRVRPAERGEQVVAVDRDS